MVNYLTATLCSLTWSGAALGTHALSAKVVATDGGNATSALVNVTVSDLAVTLLLLDGSTKLIELTDVREVTQVL